MTLNMLSWKDYKEDGGELTYPQWIQCLIDSENLDRETGNYLLLSFSEGSVWLQPDKADTEKTIENSYGTWLESFDGFGRRSIALRGRK
uniref:Uncharacterized protein n=1 Tax=viral metagenome TaxID=1070528 RepID=A0A6M3LXV9_9ZZZZ